MKQTNISTLTRTLVRIYDKHGQYGVYRFAYEHPGEFEKQWSDCIPCEDTTPTVKGDNTCAVCGSLRKDYQ